MPHSGGTAGTVTFLICTPGVGQLEALRYEDRVALRQKYITTEIFQKWCVTSTYG